MIDLTTRRVLVTGAAGFLGRQVCDQLERRGVHDLIRPAHDDIDLTHQEPTFELIAAVRPDVVIHLAAEVGGIGANSANPGRYFYANAVMGINLIEASRMGGIEKFVQVGTVCAYPKHTAIPFREDDLWDGYPDDSNAPYGIAKRALAVMLQAYREQYGLRGIFLLPANLYGPGDNFDLDTSHVIPAIIRKFVEARDSGAQEVEVWGTGSASREFLFVADAARAIILASERYDSPDPVNLGTNVEITIRDLVDTVQRLVGFSGRVRWDSSKPDGQPRRNLETSRARERFGFEATTALEEGLEQTIQWWEKHRAEP